MPGRACMTFNEPVTPTVDINIETKRYMSPYYPLQELVSSIGPGCDLAQDNSSVLQRIGTKSWTNGRIRHRGC